MAQGAVIGRIATKWKGYNFHSLPGVESEDEGGASDEEREASPSKKKARAASLMLAPPRQSHTLKSTATVVPMKESEKLEIALLTAEASVLSLVGPGRN